jgi:hypothetical protein
VLEDRLVSLEKPGIANAADKALGRNILSIGAIDL